MDVLDMSPVLQISDLNPNPFTLILYLIVLL